MTGDDRGTSRLGAPNRPDRTRLRRIQAGIAVLAAVGGSVALWNVVRDDPGDPARPARSAKPAATKPAGITVGRTSGAAAALTTRLAKAQFRCSDLPTRSGPVRNCFRPGGGGLAAWQDVQFTFTNKGVLTAATVRARDLARGGAGRQLSGALTQIVPVLTPKDTRRVLAAAAAATPLAVAGGRTTTTDRTTTIDWRWERSKATPIAGRLPVRSATTTVTAFQSGIRKAGYACNPASVCVKGPLTASASVNAVALPGGSRVGAVLIDVETAASGVPALARRTVREATGALTKERSAAVLAAYLNGTLDGKPHQAYVAGWLVKVRPVATGDGVAVVIRSPHLAEFEDA